VNAERKTPFFPLVLCAEFSPSNRGGLERKGIPLVFPRFCPPLCFRLGVALPFFPAVPVHIISLVPPRSSILNRILNGVAPRRSRVFKFDTPRAYGSPSPPTNSIYAVLRFFFLSQVVLGRQLSFFPLKMVLFPPGYDGGIPFFER